ncbi:MAG: glycosyltransferase family 39 protein [Candidatus Bathyarchaeota archaeon]|nr:glycosyltransferase family 39 protein [Candidatus Bathyarchaeota archaeon]
MFGTSRKYLLLLLIFAFAFTYRMLLMHWATYPPGADIGLHQSVIYSITGSGNTNFLWNYYQMGGGLSLTFPGYHIFVSYVIMMTGMPDYLAHSVVVSLFSSLIVLCAYLIVRTIQGEPAALIVAFLVAISRFDVEMLLWGGYPNAVTLMLIPLVFYLFLQRDRFSLVPFLAVTAILSGSIFLTHSLSAVIFVLITLLTVMLVTAFSKKLGVPRTYALVWLVPLFLGALLVSPFLIDAAPAYLSANADTFTGGIADIRQALLSTRVLPLELVLPPLICVPFFFFFSKKYRNHFFTVPSLFMAIWILVPLLFTQTFLVGLYTDYNRFLYYTVLPVIIIIALGIDHGSGFFARIVDTYLSFTKQTSQAAKSSRVTKWLMPRLTRKNLYSSFVVGLLLVAFFAVPIFLTPSQGVTVQSFYQVMNDPEYEAIQWARQNTPIGSVFVSDALYGWWFSGFAQRPTLSAVDPQYLTLAREFEPAKAAKLLLDTDYMIDNGLIQVREDGGYIARHNPVIVAKLNWTYFPYSFLNFNNSETQVKYRVSDSPMSITLDQLTVKEMHMENDSDHATVTVTKGNNYFNYTELITVYRGSRFVNMSITLTAATGVSLDWLDFIVHSNGRVLTQQNNTIALLDEGVKAFSQLIFAKEQPNVDVVNRENPCIFELDYNMQGKTRGEIQFSATAYSVTDRLEYYQSPEVTADYFNKIIIENLNTYQKIAPDSPALDVFDYRKAVADWNVSYIACRDSEIMPKFADDPAFGLVFINDAVAVFMVKRGFA